MKKIFLPTLVLLLLVASLSIQPLVLGHHRPGHAKGPGGNGGGGGDIEASIDLIQCDLFGGAAKWRDSSSPDGLKDRITYNISNVAGVNEATEAAVREGIEEWNNILSPYILQETIGDADVTVSLYFKVTPGYILGYADPVCSAIGTLDSVKIVLGVKGLRTTGVQNLAAHEMGHALGLGHSDYNQDLMYAAFDTKERKNVFCPSNLDLSALSIDALDHTVFNWKRLTC